ncbi:MAG: hypothetical protein E7455_01740 [Ruminococcaceae bacterium]|nr:hypothetical protein [Oscillospiraceae bacterium]
MKKLLRTVLSVVMVATLILGSVSMLAGCQPTDTQNPDSDNNHALDYVGLEKEEYLQKLGENNLGDAIDSVGEVYGELLAGLGNSSAASQSGGAKVNMTITVGDTALDLFEQLIFGGEAPVDISFLKEISLDMDLGMDGQKQAIQMALGLKGQHIITANLLMNMADSVMHIGLPELNDQWLKIATGENVPNVITGGMSSTAMLAELADALPDAETLTKVLDRYLAIVLDGLKNVDQSTTTLSVGGVSQECTVLTLKLNEEDAMNIVKSVLTKAKDDTDLKKIIEDFAKAVEEMAGEDIGADEAYVDFKEGIEDLLAELEAETEFDTESFIQVDTYVDKNHNVIGMKMYGMSEQDSERGMMYFYSLTEGNKTAFEFAIPSDVDDTDDFKISGTGTKTGGKTSGTYTVSMQDMDMVTIKIADLNEEAGTITLAPNMDLFPGEVADMLGDLALEIKLSADGIALNILGDSEVLLGIALKAVDSNGPSLDAPSNAVDITDSSALERWTEQLVMDKVMDNLEKAGAYEFFEALFTAVESPKQEAVVQPNYGYTDDGWG